MHLLNQPSNIVCFWRFLEYFMIMTLLDPSTEIKECSVHLVSFTTLLGSILSTEESFSWFIKFQLGNLNVGWVDWNLNLGAVLLVSNNLFDVDAPSSSVDGKDLTGLSFNTTFFRSALDENGVSLSKWNGFAVILGSEFLAKWGAHHLSSQGGWSTEVSLSSLSSLTGYT